MHLIHDRIWTTNGEGELIPRPGELDIDPLDSAELLEEAPYVLHVGGLKPQDFAVFLETEAFNQHSGSYGYLVTSVDPGGEGILVLGDAIGLEPATWMNERVVGMIRLLGQDQVAEFGLESLHRVVQRSKNSN